MLRYFGHDTVLEVEEVIEAGLLGPATFVGVDLTGRHWLVSSALVAGETFAAPLNERREELVVAGLAAPADVFRTAALVEIFDGPRAGHCLVVAELAGFRQPASQPALEAG